jgi:hypothetical protein
VYDEIVAGRSPHDAAERGLASFPRDLPIGIIAVGARGWGATCSARMAFAVSAMRRTL